MATDSLGSVGYGYGYGYDVAESPFEQLVDIELLRVLPEYYIIRDALLGEYYVKRQGQRYLPPPTSSDTQEARDRYRVFLQRADFWNYTQRFHSSLVGQAFLNEPKIELPPQLEFLRDDVDGKGTSIIQLAKAAFGFLLSYSRCGFHTDFPATRGAVTVDRADEYRPYIRLNSPFKILSSQRDERNNLVGVMIEESYQEFSQFVTHHYLQYKHLRIVNGRYGIGVYRPERPYRLGELPDLTCVAAISDIDQNLQLYAEFSPSDSTGAGLDRLPFEFCGGDNNTEFVDRPHLSAVANANFSDYRTSADTEEMMFLGGQPTVWISNPDAAQMVEQFPDGVPLGSRSVIPLGEGGSAGVVQIGASDALTNNMQIKRERLADLGVPITSIGRSDRTATEVQIDNLISHASMSSGAQNLSAALTASLKHAARFVGAPDEDILFELDFTQAIRSITIEERNQNLIDMEAGLLTREEARSHLERAGKTFVDTEEALVIAREEREGIVDRPDMDREEEEEDEEEE